MEALGAVIDVERKALAEDLEEMDRLSGRIARAEGTSSSAASRFVQSVREGTSDAGALDTALDALRDAESRQAADLERRRTLAGRIVERARLIGSLREEIARRKAGLRVLDALTGRWEVQINPGPRRGIYRLVLDGTLVSGDYTLDGGYRGSVRGTLVGDKVTLQRIDSTLGFDATFYGKLVPAQKKISGTWEATAIAPASGPTAGTWVGTFLPDRDDQEGEKQ